jgi:hypothetical protein
MIENSPNTPSKLSLETKYLEIEAYIQQILADRDYVVPVWVKELQPALEKLEGIISTLQPVQNSTSRGWVTAPDELTRERELTITRIIRGNPRTLHIYQKETLDNADQHLDSLFFRLTGGPLGGTWWDEKYSIDMHPTRAISVKYVNEKGEMRRYEDVVPDVPQLTVYPAFISATRQLKLQEMGISAVNEFAYIKDPLAALHIVSNLIDDYSTIIKDRRAQVVIAAKPQIALFTTR